jgi:hypothetical protein
LLDWAADWSVLTEAEAEGWLLVSVLADALAEG